VRVTAERLKGACSDDIIHKDIHLRDPHLNAVPCHLMNGNGKYVIVLQQQRIVVQTLQQQTPLCMSTVQYIYYEIAQASKKEMRMKFNYRKGPEFGGSFPTSALRSMHHTLSTGKIGPNKLAETVQDRR